MSKIKTKQLSNDVSKNLNKKHLKSNLIDDVRNHFGYISSSNILKLWIMKFSVNELVNDLKWIYDDDKKTLSEISKLLKQKNK
jgi:hypothetical protein